MKDYQVIDMIANDLEEKDNNPGLVTRLREISQKMYERWHMDRYGVSPGVYTG